MIKVIPHWLTFFIALNISFIGMLATGIVGGEMNVTLSLSNLNLFLFYILNAFSFLVVLFLTSFLFKFEFKSKYKLKVDYSKFLFFFVSLLLFDVIFTFYTGTGVLFSDSDSKFSFLGAIFNPLYLMPIFYIKYRFELNKYLFFFIIFIFAISQIQKGWSGFFLLLFFLELFLILQKMHLRKVVFFSILTPLFVIFFGALVYKLILPVKQEIRGLGYTEVSYSESLVALVSRLTYFPVAVAGFQKADEVSKYYEVSGNPLKEVYGFFKPILPKILMNDKSFRSLNNNVKQPYFDLDAKTSADIGFVGYFYILAMSSPMDAILSLCMIVIFLFLIKLFYDLVADYRGQYQFLVYLTIFSVFYTVSIEHVFSRNFLGIFYLLPIMIFFGVIRFRRLFD